MQQPFIRFFLAAEQLMGTGTVLCSDEERRLLHTYLTLLSQKYLTSPFHENKSV